MMTPRPTACLKNHAADALGGHPVDADYSKAAMNWRIVASHLAWHLAGHPLAGHSPSPAA